MPFIKVFIIVLPIYIVMAVGLFARKIGLINEQTRAGISKIVFYLAAPCLIFHSLAYATTTSPFNLNVILICLAILLLGTLATYLLGVLLKWPKEITGTFCQGAYRSNMVFFGLPVIELAFGTESLPLAAIFISFMMPTYNLLAVIVLTLPHHALGKNFKPWPILKSICLNPILIACAAGLIESQWQLLQYEWLQKTLGIIGRTALPLALLEVGCGIRLEVLKGLRGIGGLNVALRLIAFPAVFFLVFQTLGYNDMNTKIAIVLMACPTAMISYVMAKEMKGDSQFASRLVILSTLLSILTIPLWLLILGV